MTHPPLRQYASVPLSVDPSTAAQRLCADPQGVVSQATAAALTAMGPHVRRWGLGIAELPLTAARTLEADGAGAVEVVWAGTEEMTGWPALSGRLVVTPTGAGGSRVLLLSARAQAELATDRLDPVHRQRIVRGSIQRFLQELGRCLDDPGASPPTAHLARSDHAPMFVHHLEPLSGDPRALYDHLLVDPQGLAHRATMAAVAGARETLAAGRFRAAPTPAVRAWQARAGEPASAWVRWRDDEEATGWPQLELAVLIEAHAVGSRIAVLSTREPRYDLSLPRLDKHQRDRILRTAGRALAEAVRGELTDAASLSEPDPQRDLVPTGR